MPVSRTAELGFRQSHAFVIGINEYQGLDANLKTARGDSEEIAKRLKVLQGFDNVLLMNNVGKEQIMALLNWLKATDRPAAIRIPDQEFSLGSRPYRSRSGWLRPATDSGLPTDLPEVELTFDAATHKLLLAPEATFDIQPEDSIVFYYAGHGFPGEVKDGPAGFLAPTDALNKLVDNETLIPMDEVYHALSEIKCKHTLLILDCCFAGKFRFSSLSRGRPRPFLMPMYKRRYERYKSSDAWQVLVSAGPEQTANDSAKWAAIRDHSPFAVTLIEALEGRADIPAGANRGKSEGDGIITATELFLYVWDRVERLTGEVKPQHPGLFPMAQHREGEFIFLNPKIDSDRFRFAEDPDKNPYKGLLPYEQADSAVFFGRERVVQQIVARLQQEDLLFITGPSGSGKSSVVKAGVFPALQGVDAFLYSRPSELATSESAERRKFQELEAQLTSDRRQVLLLDQYEELFNLPEQGPVEWQLKKLIETAINRGKKVILTMRSDFEWQLKNSRIGTYWNKKRVYHIPPMDLDELRQALTGPAWWAMYDFRDRTETDEKDTGEALINEILEEVAYAPGALPLLSFTMQSFYEIARDRRQRLLLDDYRNVLQGVSGALSQRADTLYKELSSDDHRRTMKHILLRLATLSDGGYTRRRVFLSHPDIPDLNELEFPDDQEGKIVQEVLTLLEAKQLVAQGKDSQERRYVEPVHDALINFWPLCREWLEAFGKDNLVLQRQLWQAVLDQHLGEQSPLSQKTKDNFSPYWDTNPKLQQLIVALMNAGNATAQPNQKTPLGDAIQEINEHLRGDDRQQFRGLLNEWRNTGTIPNLDAFILSGTSDEILAIYLKEGKHWLNRAEEAFIQKSWEKRTEDILELKRQRDEALAQSRSNGNAFRALQLDKNDHTLALRLAEMNYLLHPGQQSSVEIFRNFLHDFEKAKYAHIFRGHTENVTSAAFSPDGKYVVTGSKDKTARLWDRQGKALQTFRGHTGRVFAVAFAPDSTRVLSGSDNGTARLWDLQGNEMQSFQGHEKGIYAAAFSPDGNQILTGSWDGTAKLWDLNGHEIQTFHGHDGNVLDVATSPDGRQVLTGSKDKTAKLWSTDGSEVQTFRGHTAEVNAVAFSPDGQYVLTGSKDATAKVWDLAGHELQHLTGHMPPVDLLAAAHLEKLLEASITSVGFSPDGQRIVTASEDKRAKVWNMQGKQLQTLRGHTMGLYDATFSPDGRHLLTASRDKTARLWIDWNREGFETLTFPAQRTDIECVALSPDGQAILTGARDGTVTLWDIHGREVQVIKAHSRSVATVAFSPDGQTILTGAADRTARLWDTDGNEIRSLKGHTGNVEAAVFSPDGQRILTGAMDKTAKLWDTAGNELQSFPGHSAGILSATFSPDGTRLLTGSWDQTARLWDLEGNLLHTFPKQTDRIYAVAFSSDGQSLLIASRTATLWDLEGKQLQEFDGQSITAVAFSPDGRWILTGSDDNTAKLWDWRGNDLQHLTGHTGGITGLAFSPDGCRIVTTSRDKTAKIWLSIKGYLRERVAAFSVQELEDVGLQFLPEDVEALNGI